MKGGADSCMTPSCLTSAESLPSPKPQLLSMTANASAASHNAQFLGIPHTHTRFSFLQRFPPRADGSLLPTHLGGTPALQPGSWLRAMPLHGDRGRYSPCQNSRISFSSFSFLDLSPVGKSDYCLKAVRTGSGLPEELGVAWATVQQGTGVITAWEELCQAL